MDRSASNTRKMGSNTTLAGCLAGGCFRSSLQERPYTDTGCASHPVADLQRLKNDIECISKSVRLTDRKSHEKQNRTELIIEGDSKYFQCKKNLQVLLYMHILPYTHSTCTSPTLGSRVTRVCSYAPYNEPSLIIHR